MPTPKDIKAKADRAILEILKQAEKLNDASSAMYRFDPEDSRLWRDLAVEIRGPILTKYGIPHYQPKG
jgi:hypothetical protein